MRSSLLAFFALAASASAQIPKGYFFLRNEASAQVVDVKDGSLKAGAILIMSDRKKANFDSQLWTYQLDQGFFINKKSGLVIDIPERKESHVEYGELLEQRSKTDGSHKAYQQWDYRAKGKQVVRRVRDNVCLSGNDTYYAVTVDICASKSERKDQLWFFDAAPKS